MTLPKSACFKRPLRRNALRVTGVYLIIFIINLKNNDFDLMCKGSKEWHVLLRVAILGRTHSYYRVNPYRIDFCDSSV